MTVLEVIQRSSAFLEKKGVDSPRLQAELLLAHHLGLPRMRLYLDFERVLTPGEIESVRELVARRGRREPLQQIIGSTSFCGLEIRVSRHVLVPRPETELLAEFAWNFLLRNAATQPRPPEVLDFGTGSGCLAVTLATKCPSAHIWAIDVSQDALAIARLNAAHHAVADRITFHESDGLAGLPAEMKFNLIVGNPPYIPTAEIATLQPEVRDYEPHHALNGGDDGLLFYRELSASAPARLLPGGQVMLEFGDGQQPALAALFHAQNWVVEQFVEDYTGRQRVLIARQKTDEQP